MTRIRKITPDPPKGRVRPVLAETLEISAKLRAFRHKRGISYRKLGEISGVSEDMVLAIEMNRRIPTVDVLLKLCKGLEISPRILFPGKK